MSVEAMAIVLNHSQARGAAKLVLLGIANHINPDNDGAWPSQATLARYANVSDRAVRSAVDQLVELGELRVEVAGGHSMSQYKTNRYWLELSCPDDCDGTVSHRTRVEVSDTRVEVFDNQGGSQLPTNRNRTIKEPKLNKGTRLDPNWKPSAELIEWAKKTRPDINVQMVADNFVDYWVSRPSNATKLDWDRTFRTWVRNTKVQRVSGVTQKRVTNVERNLAFVQGLMKEQKAIGDGQG